MDAEIIGVLELSDGCLYVTSADTGDRYPIVWPAETLWDGEARAVVTPDGETLPLGIEVYGAGAYFEADKVEPVAGRDASVRARDCAEGPDVQVIVVNNEADAIGRSSQT